MIFFYLFLDLIVICGLGYGLLYGLKYATDKEYIGVSSHSYSNNKPYVDQETVRTFAGVIFSIFSVLIIILTLILNLKGC